MPSGVFKPYAGVSTAILIFTKTEHGGTDHVWFYDMKADGFSLDDKRTPVAENDIPDIIERFENREKEVDRKRTEQSFMVPKKDIVENEYDLSINKYKEVEYIPVEYPPTSEIMANIRELENEIGKEMDELEKLLKMQRELISTQPQYSYSQQAIDFIYDEIKKHRVRYSMTGRINYQKNSQLQEQRILSIVYTYSHSETQLYSFTS